MATISIGSSTVSESVQSMPSTTHPASVVPETYTVPLSTTAQIPLSNTAQIPLVATHTLPSITSTATPYNGHLNSASVTPMVLAAVLAPMAVLCLCLVACFCGPGAKRFWRPNKAKVEKGGSDTPVFSWELKRTTLPLQEIGSGRMASHIRADDKSDMTVTVVSV